MDGEVASRQSRECDCSRRSRQCRGDAAALFEAFIDAAVDSAEDRKCAVLANLYASLAFDGSASIDDALLYVKRVRDSSWRQLVALQYLVDESRTNERELAGVKGEEGDAKAAAPMAAEMEELAETLGLVGVGQEGGAIVDPTGTMGGGGFYTALYRAGSQLQSASKSQALVDFRRSLPIASSTTLLSAWLNL